MIGIGEDCAFIPQGDAMLALSTDSLVEDVHFRRRWITARQLGAKSLLVNLSDLASCGAQPLAALVSLSLPKALGEDWAHEFAQGLKEISDKYSVPIIGGDTTQADKVFVNLTVLGKCAASQIKSRSAAIKGDILFTTGALGDSLAGLQILEKELERMATLIDAHLAPKPQLDEGFWLSQRSEVHALMDLSDGIMIDLPRLAKASRLGFQVRFEDLPLSTELKTYALDTKQFAPEMALVGGEDYCLLGSAARENFSALAQDYYLRFGRPLFKIGEVAEGSPNFTLEGRSYSPSLKVFSHFE